MDYICGSNVPVFDIGLFTGTKQPSCVFDYLKGYAEEKESLEADGVFVSPGRIMKKFRLNVISADAPARCHLSGSRYSNQMNGCSRCDQTCTSVGKRRIYSTTVGRLRTDNVLTLDTTLRLPLELLMDK